MTTQERKRVAQESRQRSIESLHATRETLASQLSMIRSQLALVRRSVSADPNIQLSNPNIQFRELMESLAQRETYCEEQIRDTGEREEEIEEDFRREMQAIVRSEQETVRAAAQMQANLARLTARRASDQDQNGTRPAEQTPDAPRWKQV